MKRNSLTTAVVAGIAGVAGFAGLASAVELNPDGLGQVLLYPYYTVNKGQDTMLSVVNTTDVGKAVKVRFLEGYNSREVLDFNLFLSAHDVWTAVVTTTGDNAGGRISTEDSSCTYPKVGNIGSPQPFRTAAFDGTGANPADSGPHDITRTREGYFEIISMGDIRDGSPTSGRITHVQGSGPNEGVPPGCAAVNNSNVVGDLDPPSGGLFGAASIINVNEGTLFGYNADAIDGFTNRVLFSASSDLTPSLQDANTAPTETNLVARAYVFINGSLVQADYARGVDAVSAVYMSDAIYNEYIVGAGLGANTDWVVTFPTKRFYVDGGLYSPTPRLPFVERFAGGESNVTVQPSLFDQEEGYTTAPDDFSPPISTQPNALPFEVNVISFLSDTEAGDPSGVFGSVLRPNIKPYGDAGWLKLDLASGDGGHYLPGGVAPDGVTPVVFNGLPTTGFYGFNVINENAQPGKLANYSGLFRHRASRSLCEGGCS